MLFSKKNQQKVTILIKGMSCSHCTSRMREAFLQNKAVKKADVSLDDGGKAIILYDADKTNEDKLKNIVTETGYELA